jgi:hypothetical protein
MQKAVVEVQLQRGPATAESTGPCGLRCATRYRARKQSGLLHCCIVMVFRQLRNRTQAPAFHTLC